jgi:hypothetical protein
MIEKFYAAHIKTVLDATAINVRKGVIQRERESREGAIPTDRQVSKAGRKATPRRGRNAREGAMDQR